MRLLLLILTLPLIGCHSEAESARPTDAAYAPEALPGAAEPERADEAALAGGDWAQYRGGPRGTWENPGRLTKEQARRLAPAWTANAGPMGYTQPIVVGESVFVTSAQEGNVYAFDLATGAQKWKRTFDQVFTDPCQPRPSRPGFWSAPAWVDGTLFVAAPDGKVYALDPSTGATLRESPVATTRPPELIQSSPAASARLGRLFVGVASLFTCHHIAGRVISVDLATGESNARTLTEGGRAGASVWSSVSIDEDRGRIFVTTGDPVEQPLADVPLAQSFVALDAASLEVVDHWQNPGPGPRDNSDFGASPTLFDAADGTPLVAATNKDGWLYTLNRERLSEGPLWRFQVAQGGADPLKGQGSLVAPTFAGGVLYAAGGSTPDGEAGSVVALHPSTGARIWRHVTPGFVFAGMPAVGDILVVVSNATDGTRSWLEVLDRLTGESLARFEADGPSYGAPTVAQGRILWYTAAGELRAFTLPE